MPVEDDPWVKEHSAFGIERLHALGVVTTNWNWCEYHAHEIFGIVTGVKMDVSRAISHDMGDVSLWERIITISETRALQAADALEALRYASKLYTANRTNRNLLVHAQGITNREHTSLADIIKLTRNKGPKREWLPILDSLESIRQVADDIGKLRKYLLDLSVVISVRTIPAHAHHALPDRPPLPNPIWSSPQTARPKRRPPPQSS